MPLIELETGTVNLLDWQLKPGFWLNELESRSDFKDWYLTNADKSVPRYENMWFDYVGRKVKVFLDFYHDLLDAINLAYLLPDETDDLVSVKPFSGLNSRRATRMELLTTILKHEADTVGVVKAWGELTLERTMVYYPVIRVAYNNNDLLKSVIY